MSTPKRPRVRFTCSSNRRLPSGWYTVPMRRPGGAMGASCESNSQFPECEIMSTMPRSLVVIEKSRPKSEKSPQRQFPPAAAWLP